MRLDPHTRLDGLLTAIPSSARVFDRLGIPVKGNENKTLHEVCTAEGISVEEFLHAMDEIDWTEESPAKEESRRSVT